MIVEGPHVVLLELYHRGHHGSYVEMLVDGWIKSQQTGRLTLLVTADFKDAHSELISRIQTFSGHQISCVTLEPAHGLDGKTGLAKLMAANRAHKKALLEAIKLQPDHIVCMFFDHAQGAVASLRSVFSKAGITISGIVFRSTIHEKTSGLRNTVQSFRKRVILKSALQSKAITRLFCLDPMAPEGINQLAGRNMASWLPDGTTFAPPDVTPDTLRKLLGIAEDETLFLFFGALSSRKGIYQTLDAFKQLSGQKACLVIAGTPEPDEASAIFEAISGAQKVARIVLVSGAITDARMTSLFEASDVVLAAYPRHTGSSGILIRAAAAGKPVVGSNFGMVGRNIKEHGLGFAVDCTNVDLLANTLQEATANPFTHFDAALSAAFASSNSSDAFAQTILNSLTLGLNGIRRICVQWPRFGPYHLARLKAFHEKCEPLGIEIVGLETAAQSDLYEWRVESGKTSFRREQVFTDRSFESISPSEMHDAVTARLNELQPDVVAIHTYSLPDSRACLLWCKDNGKASIVMTDSKADDAKRSKWKEYLKSSLIASYDAAFLAGQPQQAYFEQLNYPGSAIHLGYNAVDNAFFADPTSYAGPKPLPGLESDEPFMLASNRFLERKNLSNLLSAYGRYRTLTEAPYRLILLGDGALRGEVEHQVKEEGIDGVFFAGFRQIEELPVYYSRASFFVHPSRVDTWALVVNEAMAAGLPVLVCTGAGCHKDLVESGINGFVFGPDEVDVLANQMKRLTEDPDFAERAGKASKEIVARWDLDRCSRGLLEAAATAWKRKGRRMDPISGLVINLLRRSKSSNAFHSVES